MSAASERLSETSSQGLTGTLRRFKSLLAPGGPEKSPSKQIEIRDVKYHIFQVHDTVSWSGRFVTATVIEPFDPSADDDDVPVLRRNRLPENSSG